MDFGPLASSHPIEDFGGEADEFRLRPGDLIQLVQRKPVKTVEELRKLTGKKALSEGVVIHMKERRTGSGRTIFLRNQ